MERPESTLIPFSCYESASPWWARRGVGCRSAAEPDGQRRRRSWGATAGRRPWPTLTCDADRYGDACRDCHVCAVHERKRPSRMREWQWAETVNRTEKGGGYARAFRQRRVCVDETVQTRATGTGYGDIGSYRIHIGVTIQDPGPGRGRRAFSVARGGVRADVLLRCTAVVLLRRVRGNNFCAHI